MRAEQGGSHQAGAARATGDGAYDLSREYDVGRRSGDGSLVGHCGGPLTRWVSRRRRLCRSDPAGGEDGADDGRIAGVKEMSQKKRRGLPELPDVVVDIEALEQRFLCPASWKLYAIASPFLLRGLDPPLESAAGKIVKRLRRVGKRIASASKAISGWCCT